jgi:hypothetical protein
MKLRLILLAGIAGFLGFAAPAQIGLCAAPASMSLKRPRPSLGAANAGKLCRCGTTHGTTILGVAASSFARHGLTLRA